MYKCKYSEVSNNSLIYKTLKKHREEEATESELER